MPVLLELLLCPGLFWPPSFLWMVDKLVASKLHCSPAEGILIFTCVINPTLYCLL